MRVISYDIGIDKITPQGQQYGGIQGEHKATKICVTLNSELKSELQSEASGCDINVRIDAEDSAGTYYAGQVTSINPSNETVTINYDIEQFLTSAGIANLRLVISAAKDNKPEKILYSYPMILKFDASFDGEEAQKKIAEDITPAVAQAVAAASTAQTAANSAAKSAAQAANEVDSNAVKFSAEQELSDEQKEQARDNIDAISTRAARNLVDVEIALNTVKYTQNQLLSSEQQAQARFNIGAVGTDSVSTTTSVQYPDKMIPTVGAAMTFAYDLLNDNAVRYSLVQKLSDEQKAVARSNIGAVSSSDLADAISTATDDLVDTSLLAGAINASTLYTVSAANLQDFTDAQKNTARENIGAVSADNVVLKSTDKPDVDTSKLIYSIAGVQSFLYKNTVLGTIDQSTSEVANWTDAKKARARKNIDVDGGKWVLLRTYTTDGVNKAFGDGTTSNVGTTTTDGDGNALSLSAVSVVFKNTAAAAANSYAALFAYTASGENEYGGYSVSTNAINTKENAQGVMTVFADRGYYRSLSIDGALKNSAYARENPSQAFVMTSDSVINKIKIALGAIPPADDIIEIWGIKA